MTGSLEARIEKINLSQEVKLEPGEVKTVIFSSDNKRAGLANPRIWWTHDLGQPELYDLVLSFRTNLPLAVKTR